MKKTIFKTLLAAAFTMVAGYSVYASQQKVKCQIQLWLMQKHWQMTREVFTDPALDQERPNARW